MSGVIFDVKRFAIHDGPGIRTTVFFKGCPLRCGWCHNPEGIAPQPELSFRATRCVGCGACVRACASGAIVLADARASTDAARCVRCGMCTKMCLTGAREAIGRTATVEELVGEIGRDRVFYEESGGGVTFSGGDPLMQADFLAALLLECRARGLHTAVDTSGYAAWEVFESLRGLVDLFLCDIKHMDGKTHQRLAGVDNSSILDNLRRLAAADGQITARMPVIRGLNDDERNVRTTGAFVASLPGVTRIDILPYNEGGCAKLARLLGSAESTPFRSPEPEALRGIAGILAGYGLDVTIGG
jgi:pyruvate formate lyase activating enzyme